MSSERPARFFNEVFDFHCHMFLVVVASFRTKTWLTKFGVWRHAHESIIYVTH